MIVIDAHTHIISQDGSGSLENLISILKKTSISKVVVLAIHPEIPNEPVRDAFLKYPEKIIPFASLNPLEKESCKKLNYLIKKLKFKGLKIHPRKQKFEISDKKILPLLKEAENLKIPVVIDTFIWKSEISLEGLMPIHIDKIARKLPGLKIIMAHAGGMKFEDAFLVAKVNENVFWEISYTISLLRGSPYEEKFIFLMKKLGADKIIYGSDHPYNSLDKTYIQTYLILKKYRFTEKEKEYIFGKTFLSITGEKT